MLEKWDTNNTNLPVPTHRHVYHHDSWAACGLVFQAGTYFKCFSFFYLHCIPFFEGKFMPSPCTAFSRPSRSIHNGDISGSNRRETPHFFAWTKWPETCWPLGIMRPRDEAREICFSFSATSQVCYAQSRTTFRNRVRSGDEIIKVDAMPRTSADGRHWSSRVAF